MIDIFCNILLFLDDYIDLINFKNYILNHTDSLEFNLDKYIMNNYFIIRNIIVKESYYSINLQKNNYVLSIPKSEDLKSFIDLLDPINIKYFKLISNSFLSS